MQASRTILYIQQDLSFIVYADHTSILCKYRSECKHSWNDTDVDHLYDHFMCDRSDLEDRGMRFWSIVVQIYEERICTDRSRNGMPR